ncbi:MAG: PDDEXK nuclease domain-containing protein [Candidatus Accumulibacter sp. UW25]|jgi:predicted nuclease of restriction endonuclease-like (RecB) superfamily
MKPVQTPQGQHFSPTPADAAAQQDGFAEVVELIQAARERALSAVNTVLIDLYWQVGKTISARIASDGWGKSTVTALSSYIQSRHLGLRGFSPQNLWRMRQFYETWCDQPELSTLLRELPWSAHLHILAKTKRPEEREFYLRMSSQQRWPVREVARQIDSALFERAVLHPPKLSTALRELHPGAEAVFRDAYVVEFLELPNGHREADLHQSLLRNLRRFLSEMGRDFCFIGSEVPLQVGGRDFALDLLFFHRELNCLIAIELKIGEFQPEHLGKLEFYLEALDRDLRKPHEGPSIGLLLCASKDSEVVEYALSRSLSPALVAEYWTRLPDRKLLQAKLHEFYTLTDAATPDEPNQKDD